MTESVSFSTIPDKDIEIIPCPKCFIGFEGKRKLNQHLIQKHGYRTKTMCNYCLNQSATHRRCFDRNCYCYTYARGCT